MACEFAKAFYRSKQWLKCRGAYIAYRRSVDGGLCETCYENPGYIVHHKIELTPDNINDPEIALGFSNLKYDCHICHNKENGRGDGKVSGLVPYVFGTGGEILICPPDLSCSSGKS